jgi:4-hydroxythreonine-4-phosphate dehydrogenase
MLPLALTLGEPAGIGPDLTLKLWAERGARNLPPFFLVADPAFVAGRAKLLSLDIPVAECAPEEAESRFPSALPLVVIPERAGAEPGKPDAVRSTVPCSSYSKARPPPSSRTRLRST